MSISIELNGLVFEIPTKGQRDWSDLTDWILEVNETLASSSDSFIIVPSTANLVNGSPVNLYTVNSPSDNAHIVFEYGITRITTGGGAVSKTETGTMVMTYDSVAGTWTYTTTAVAPSDVSVELSVSGANVIQATASALTGTPSVSQISYRGRIIRS